MLRFILLVCLVGSCSVQVNGQVEKNTWLIGGDVVFSSTRQRSEASAGLTINSFKMVPAIGYFVIDQLAAGLKLGYSNILNRQSADHSNRNVIYSAGPFVRYYFLPASSPYNILINGECMYNLMRFTGRYPYPDNAVSRSKAHSTAFAFDAGTVVFLNNVIGLELLMGYHREQHNQLYVGTLQATIGLQVYIGRNE